MEPLISVIVPVYKVEKYLQPCIDSILNQTYNNLEVILVDDGSPDKCPLICDQYASVDNRVKVIHKMNGGLSDARNTGMTASSGDFLSFVDSDDLLPCNALEILLNIAINENAELVIGSYDRFMDVPDEVAVQEITIQRWTPAEAMTDMLRNGCASWARLYRRELHMPILFPVGEINEDEAIVLQLLENCKCIAVTNALVYHYRYRPESITTSDFTIKQMSWPAHCKVNLELIREKHPELEPYAIKRYRSSLLWAMTEIALSNRNYDSLIFQLRHQLRVHKRIFSKTQFTHPQDRIRMAILMYLPFNFYRIMLRIKRNI